MTQITPAADTAEKSSRAGKPLTDEELDQARRWRASGSSISAIARRLQRSRNTIKNYLDGIRVPGHRRRPGPERHEDVFLPYAGYTRRRLAEDPHIELRPLHRELTKIGYPGSYQTLWRHLQAHDIHTSACPDCKPPQKPANPIATTDPGIRMTALPMPVSLVTDELLNSYLQRLAITNHIAVTDLLSVLPPWFRTKNRNHDDRACHHMLAPVVINALNALAALTSTPPAQLQRALPAFGSHDLPDPVRATHACHRCLAAKGIHHPIPVHRPAYQHICLRHNLWIGPAGIPHLDLSACPAISHAQRQAHLLAHRFGPEQLIFAQHTAEQDVRKMPYRPTPEPPPHHWRHRLQRLRNTNPQADIATAHDQFIRAAIYPEAIERAARAFRETSKIY